MVVIWFSFETTLGNELLQPTPTDITSRVTSDCTVQGVIQRCKQSIPSEIVNGVTDVYITEYIEYLSPTKQVFKGRN